MTARLRVLHLEDVALDAELVREVLETEGLASDVTRVEGEADFVAALDHEWDVILADYSLPGFDGLRALELAHDRRPEVPFLFVTGALKDDRAVETLKRGATDFIVKDRLGRLVPAIRRALREAEARAAAARSQRENALLYERLRDAIRAREEILAIVSHDLRNPLATVKMGAALLRVQRNPDRIDDLANRIDRAATSMTRLIDDLLDVTRIDAGNLTVERKAFDVQAAARESAELHAAVAGAKGVRVVCNAAAGLTAFGDRERFLQILSNVIGNAIKFTPAGGSIRVSTAREAGAIRVSTTDTGRGIAPEHVTQVFDRYWRGQSGDRSSVGLGLSIVKGLVEAQGGTVSLTSELGKGTTVSFTIPEADGREIAAASPRRPTVLVIDDDRMIRESLGEKLAEEGYDVVLAADGVEALDRLRSARAQLIILDLLMPRMDGFEFRRRQRDDPALAKIPTVVITASDPRADTVAPLAADELMSKPFDVKQLLNVVGRMTGAQAVSSPPHVQ